MSIPLTVNGATFNYPVNLDENWGVDATGWAQAVTSGMLQMAGGSFPLTADVNFGPNFGLVSLYYKSYSSNIASAGVIRLAKTDLIEWRNQANSANNILSVNTSNIPEWNSSEVILASGNQYLTGGAKTFSNTSLKLEESGGTDRVTMFVAPLTTDRTYTMPDAGADASFVMTEGNQTIHGVKNFTIPSGAETTPSIETNGTLQFDQTIGDEGPTFSNTTAGMCYRVTNEPSNGQSALVLRSGGGYLFEYAPTIGTPTWILSLNTNARVTIGNVVSGRGTFTPQSTLDVIGNIGVGSGVAGATSAPTNGLLVQGNIRNQALSASLPVQTNATKDLVSAAIDLGTQVTSTLPVSNGGTGNTTFTAYSVILAGTTPTGAFQNVSGLGLSGQALTSNGPSAAPTWQNVTGSGTINSGTSTHIAYYATSSNVLSDASGATLSGTYTWSGVNNYSAQDVHSAGISITGDTNHRSINASTSDSSGTEADFINTDTGSSASSLLFIQVGSTTANDPYVIYDIPSGTRWATGTDNSDGDNFKITRGGVFGTHDALIADGSTGAISILGTGTNNSAAAGFVGEYFESIASSTSLPTSTQYGDLTSISLTSGDWDVTGIGVFERSGATWQAGEFGISTTSGNSATGLVLGSNYAKNQFASTSTAVVSFSFSIPNYRISLASTTTIYLKYQGTYSAGTPVASGRLSARRVR